MGAKGATAAGDAADVVILVDSLAKVVDAVSIGRHTLRVALTAIWIGIGLSVGLMLIAMTGVIPAVVGALVQELVDLATILYALRALSGPPSTLPATPARTAAPEELAAQRR
jgi:cation transport ATPase